MEYVLIILFYAGILSNTDSVAIDHIHGFKSLIACEEAGEKAYRATNGTKKTIKYACVEVK